MRATSLGSLTRTSRRWGAGRVCTHQGCLTQLSTYNPTELCAVHQHDVQISYRAPRRSKRDIALDAADTWDYIEEYRSTA
jgi:hypothetical protein